MTLLQWKLNTFANVVLLLCLKESSSLKACDFGYFGLNCSSTCHCRNNASCHNVNGTCENGLCEDGWQGISCSHACHRRRFGFNCSFICHCRYFSPCSNVDGICENGLCATGWLGNSCSQSITAYVGQESEEKKPDTGQIIGAISGVISSFVVGLYLKLKIKKRRNETVNTPREENTNERPQIQQASTEETNNDNLQEIVEYELASA